MPLSSDGWPPGAATDISLGYAERTAGLGAGQQYTATAFIDEVAFRGALLGLLLIAGVNPTLANFTIEGTILTVSVNSAHRATAARTEIAQRLGEQVRFVRDHVQSIEEAMEEHAGKRETAKERAARRSNEELQSRPEVQAMLARFNADHAMCP